MGFHDGLRTIQDGECYVRKGAGRAREEQGNYSRIAAPRRGCDRTQSAQRLVAFTHFRLLSASCLQDPDARSADVDLPVCVSGAEQHRAQVQWVVFCRLCPEGPLVGEGLQGCQGERGLDAAVSAPGVSHSRGSEHGVGAWARRRSGESEG